MHSLREARFATVVADIQKRWGANAIKPLSAKPAAGTMPTIPTGFAELDGLLQGRGLPLGQLTELHGAFASGVTTLAYCILAKGQQSGMAHPAAYLDLARTFDADYAERCGVNLNRLLIVRPDSLVDLFDIAGELVARYSAQLLIIDPSFASAAGLRHAVAQATFRRFTTLVRGSACAVLCLTRPQPGVTSPIQVYASLCVHLRLVRLTRRYGDVSGCETLATVTKQKLGGGGQVRLRLSFEPAAGREGL